MIIAHLKKRKKRKKEEGLTLVELMITVFVISIGILSSLLYFVTAIASSDLAKDTLVATMHGEYILEDMRARTTLSNITSSNWAQFADDNELNTLPSESVSVVFANSISDPLQITTTVSWTRNSRPGSVALTTELTK